MLKSHGVGPSLMASLALVLVVGAPASAAGSLALHVPSPGATGDGQCGFSGTPTKSATPRCTSASCSESDLKVHSAPAMESSASPPTARATAPSQPPRSPAKALREPLAKHSSAPTPSASVRGAWSRPGAAHLAPGRSESRSPADLLPSGADHRHRLGLPAVIGDRLAQPVPVTGPGLGERVLPTAHQPPQVLASASRQEPLRRHRPAIADLSQAGRSASPPAGVRRSPGVRARLHPGTLCAADASRVAGKPGAATLAGSGSRLTRMPRVAARAPVVEITVPNGPVSLGSAAPGGTLSASMGTVTVTDGRVGQQTWITTVSATNLTTGGGGTIANSNIGYWSGGTTLVSGSSSRTPGQATAAHKVQLSAPQQAFRATKSAIATSTSTSWAPTLVITIPLSTVAGIYTATITHSAA
jgi:hypothetical protein